MVKLALLWHMHQPYYEDLVTGEHILPWVRLHAIKDYWGMVAMLEAFPRVRLTFNLVPSLIRQVQAFAEGRARDRHLDAGLKPAHELSPDEARWLIANGFHAPYARMIGPYPRYAQLHANRIAGRPFSADDLRDLQVWHKLVWMDPDLLASDPRLIELIQKGGSYSEADKTLLRSVELDILSRVIPAYRDASVRGQVELATSPFYHPILPLLCDSEVRENAVPGGPRPSRRFTRPGDARLQIERAMAFHAETFGNRPLGMWPSEGSVSDEAVALMAAAGINWIATDEDILARSLQLPIADRPDLLYRPYRIGDGGPVALFRDHLMSDRIGFHYQSWDAAVAAADFVGHVREAGRRFQSASGGEVGTVSVILDGENAWEHYEGGGRPFLRALYRALGDADDIQMVTMGEAAMAPVGRLPSIFPGSWINSDFYIWIGHRDDHRAWDQLADARTTFDQRSALIPAEARDRALEELLIAEGSDWFWWYGDDHSSDHDADFDDLFRRHLRNAYAALGSSIPAALFATNISTGAGPDCLEPSGLLAITLDGRDTSFLEWVGAVCPVLSGSGGAMHEVAHARLVSEVRVGLSADALCLRIAGPSVADLVATGAAFVAIIVAGAEVRVVAAEPGWIGVGSVIEMAIPLNRLLSGPGSDLSFAVQIRDRSGSVIEVVPHGRYWTVAVLAGGVARDWQA